MGKEKVYGVIIIVNQCVDRLFDWSTRDLRTELDNASRPRAGKSDPATRKHTLSTQRPLWRIWLITQMTHQWVITDSGPPLCSIGGLSVWMKRTRENHQRYQKSKNIIFSRSKWVFQFWNEKLNLFFEI